MDTERHSPVGPCIIVHSNPIVAADLEELLRARGASDVRTARKLDVVCGHTAELAIVAGEVEQVLDDPAVRHWIAMGTPVIVLNGIRGASEIGMGVHVIEQPFKEEHVQAILDQLALAWS
ncbi:hypothetical protein [Tropicimonas sp. S265A]|uniref:hypothetical protein n=1 Tax=Tropicimonas sp. S265A TaxID=3415134 RepID=UPI003C7A869B